MKSDFFMGKGELVRCNSGRLALARTVSRKAHNSGALTLTEATRRASDVVANRSGANHHLAPRWRRRVGDLIRREHNHNRPAFSVRKLVRVRQSVCGEIHRESVGVGGADGFPIGFRAVFVCIGEALAARVGFRELSECVSVNVLANPRQIACLIVTPKGAARKPADSRAEVIPI